MFIALAYMFIALPLYESSSITIGVYLLADAVLPSKDEAPRPSSFQVQIVDVKAGSGRIAVANIYRSPSNPKAKFLTELARSSSPPVESKLPI